MPGLPTPALYAAQPSISVDGADEPSLSVRLLTATIQEDTDGMRRCEVVFGNWGDTGQGVGFVLSDRRMVDFGQSIELDIGAGDRHGRVFSGAITGIEEHYPASRPPELVVLAEDGLQDLRMTRRSRTFEDVTDADVMRQIASDHGLRAELDIDASRYRALAQLNQSDLAFVRARARVIDAQVWLEPGTLHAQARSRRDAGTVTLTYGSDLREFSVLADLAHQRTAVGVSGWDVAAKEALEHEATVSVVQGELDGGTSGPTILEQAFGPRVERVVHTVPLSSDETRARAEAYFRATARQFVTGAGTAEGDARIAVGGNVDLVGLSRAFEGIYYVTEVSHRYDGTSGLRTSFRVERAGLGGAA